MDGSARLRALFAGLIADAAHQAAQLLDQPERAARMRMLGEDGYSAIDRLELSPLVQDQFVAVALRLSSGRAGKGATIHADLSDHFQRPALRIAIEAQRLALWSDPKNADLPMEAAEQAVDALEPRLPADGAERAAALADYAALYADLWCDPRIGAATSARRAMLAMVSALHARQAACSALATPQEARSS